MDIMVVPKPQKAVNLIRLRVRHLLFLPSAGRDENEHFQVTHAFLYTVLNLFPSPPGLPAESPGKLGMPPTPRPPNKSG